MAFYFFTFCVKIWVIWLLLKFVLVSINFFWMICNSNNVVMTLILFRLLLRLNKWIWSVRISNENIFYVKIVETLFLTNLLNLFGLLTDLKKKEYLVFDYVFKCFSKQFWVLFCSVALIEGRFSFNYCWKVFVIHFIGKVFKHMSVFYSRGQKRIE